MPDVPFWRRRELLKTGAALALGAKGALLGTRFVATRESMRPASTSRRWSDGTATPRW